MSDNRYDRPIIDIFRMLTFRLPARREQNLLAKTVFSVADTSDLPYKVLLFSNQLD